MFDQLVSMKDNILVNFLMFLHHPWIISLCPGDIRLGVPKPNHFTFLVVFLFETDFWQMASP